MRSDSRHTLAELEVWRTMAEQLDRPADLQPMLETALRIILDLMSLDTGWIILLDEQGQFYVAAAHNLPPALQADDQAALRWSPCRCQQRLLARELAEAVNIVTCERLEQIWAATRDKERAAQETWGLRYHASVPLQAGDRVLGIVNLARAGEDPLSEEELALLSLAGKTLSAAIERVRLYEAEQERARQQERLVAVGQLAAGMAHDFNNIFQTIMGFADMLSKQPDVLPLTRERLQAIIQASQRGARLIRQVLDFSRRSVIRKRPLNFARFVEEAVQDIEYALPAGIRVHLDVTPGNYTFHADVEQWQQVIANLVSNACDAMPGGGDLYFRLSPLSLGRDDPAPHPDMAPGDWIVFTVSDTGSGIQPEVLPHIFEPFFTTKATGMSSGLGLSQVYGIVRQHDGYIDVSSEVGQGTTFTLYLPVLQESQTTLAGKADSSPGQGPLVLLVEDDPYVSAALQAMLEYLGYQVLVAASGKEALDLYEAHRQDIAVVVTDMIMPAMNGIALARALRERQATVPVVVLTGYPLGEEVPYLRAQGITAWLQKPVTDETLRRTLEDVLAQWNRWERT